MDRLIAYISLAALCFFLGMEWQTYTYKVYIHQIFDQESTEDHLGTCV